MPLSLYWKTRVKCVAKEREQEERDKRLWKLPRQEERDSCQSMRPFVALREDIGYSVNCSFIINFNRPLNFRTDNFYGQMSAQANEDFDSGDEVCLDCL